MRAESLVQMGLSSVLYDEKPFVLGLSGYMVHLCIFRVCCSQPSLVRSRALL